MVIFHLKWVYSKTETMQYACNNNWQQLKSLYFLCTLVELWRSWIHRASIKLWTCNANLVNFSVKSFNLRRMRIGVWRWWKSWLKTLEKLHWVFNNLMSQTKGRPKNMLPQEWRKVWAKYTSKRETVPGFALLCKYHHHPKLLVNVLILFSCRCHYGIVSSLRCWHVCKIINSYISNGKVYLIIF